MRKFLLLTTLAAAGVIAAGITVQAQTYGPGMMGSDQYNGSHRGSGSGMMNGSGNAPGSTTGSGHGSGMMGDGSVDGGDRRGQDSHGNRPCSNEADSQRGDGYRIPCNK
ncbi:MAG: hypothetical protein WCA36_12665 [Pseudolabrys sp.]